MIRKIWEPEDCETLTISVLAFRDVKADEYERGLKVGACIGIAFSSAVWIMCLLWGVFK